MFDWGFKCASEIPAASEAYLGFCQTYGSRYSKMDQVKLICDMVCISRPYYFRFLKTAFHKFYLVHSWIPWPIYDETFCENGQSLSAIN